MSTTKNNINNNHLIFGRYKILKQIGNGAFCEVYSGINKKTKELVAIKFEPKTSKSKSLKSEAYYLFMLKSVGIPKLLSFGEDKKYNILVENLLGKSLGKILNENNKKIPLKDSLMIAIQIIERLEYLHSKLLIHRDIKLENFLIGYDDPYIIYLIDYGFCKKYRSKRTGNHVKFSKQTKFTGTVSYGSINSLKGNQSSRRDDLESAAYSIIRLMKGSLPWESIKGKTRIEILQKVYEIKISISAEQLCEGLPNEIKEFFLYSKHLNFEQEPNYKYCYSLFNNVLIKNGFSNDLIFSWIKDPTIKYKLKRKNLRLSCRDVKHKKLSHQMKLFQNLQNYEMERNGKSYDNKNSIYKDKTNNNNNFHITQSFLDNKLDIINKRKNTIPNRKGTNYIKIINNNIINNDINMLIKTNNLTDTNQNNRHSISNDKSINIKENINGQPFQISK